MRRFTCMTSAIALSAAFLTSQTAVASGDAPLEENRLSSYYGDLDPFYGDLDPFYGDLDPFYGSIDPFWGDINPFWGGINPFYGDISPFWGDINPFWGDINPFFGDISAFWGDIDPFWGDINSFWGDIAPFWGDIGPFWGDISAFWGTIDPFAVDPSSDYDQVVVMLQDLLTRSEAVWGAAVLDQTGLSFNDGFADAVFAKYGIDLTDSNSIAGLDAATRSYFFLDWYDGLMTFSGADHVDHWMPMINWSPRLTQDQGRGVDSVIGLLDVKIPDNDALGGLVNFVGGYDYSVNSHGISVAGLIAGKHDGEGVMGIAPDVTLLNYNPFDSSGTAAWSDVTSGIIALKANGANVINMSLGMPGWTLHQGWVDVFGDASIDAWNDTIFVKAAGNEGVTQTQDVDWNHKYPKNSLIIVGSVDPTGAISQFSNTPGEACIITAMACKEENKLKYRFMVAPGELILVTDSNGDLTRVSGTSFAAPLVSGAVTLMHDRWPWLQDHAEETVEIMFRSAKDLGEPGVDAVYGWGLLDIEASQSPLNFDDLSMYLPQLGYDLVSEVDYVYSWSQQSVKGALLASGGLSYFEDMSGFIYATEDIGSTFRDFNIPLSTRIYDQTIVTPDGYDERFQRHLYQRLIDWANGTGFSDFKQYSAPLFSMNGFAMNMTATPLDERERTDGFESSPFHTELGMTHAATGFGMRMGIGAGVTSIARRDGFGFKSDYDIETGGVNPILGFASGDAYASASMGVLDGSTVSVGFTSKDDDHSDLEQISGRVINPLKGFENYKASAITVGYDHTVSSATSVSVSYALLNEDTGLLGSQGTGALSLSGGVATDSVTLGATTQVAKDLTLAVSATAGTTRSTRFENSVLGVAEGGLQSTAFALSLNKQGLLNKSDGLRVTFMQPLHIESGAIEYQSVQVIDRNTGELGVVSEDWHLDTSDRKFVAEFMYVTPILQERMELSLFGQATFNGSQDQNRSNELRFGLGIGSKF